MTRLSGFVRPAKTSSMYAPSGLTQSNTTMKNAIGVTQVPNDTDEGIAHRRAVAHGRTADLFGYAVSGAPCERTRRGLRRASSASAVARTSGQSSKPVATIQRR